MSNIWFTADNHFNHENIVELSSRPFSDLEEMTETMVERWNDRVKPGDLVYHLGDFAISWGKKHAVVIDSLLTRLNGNKFLVYGNHDRAEVKRNRHWAKVVGYHEIKVDLGSGGRQRIVLCHYAMRVWNQMHRGAWMLHGHSHGNLKDSGGKTMDVGVDCHDYSPVGLEYVEELMKNRVFVGVDHHENSSARKNLES